MCSGFGPVGPLATRKGFDGAAQAFGGIVASTGTEDTPVMVRTGPLLAPASPRLLSAVTWLGVVVQVGAAVADFGGAAQLALGIMTALLRRERTGAGQQALHPPLPAYPFPPRNVPKQG